MLVDNGGFFPEQDSTYQDAAWFLMDAMKLLGTDAVGMSEKELRYGRGFLMAHVKRTQLPVVCSNLYEANSKKLLLPPSLIKQIGTVKVGVFSLISDKADLGPSRDSLYVEDPQNAARRVVADLRKRGAQVVVLLSNLGKVEGEDLVTAVDGIDAVIVGRNVAMLQKGRMIKNTIANYGGEQGQNMGRTLLTLDAKKKVVNGENDVYVLGPEVGEKAEILTLVKSFEDSFNEKLRKVEKERAVAAEAARQNAEQAVNHYMGAEVCARCHTAEYEQWKTTSHAQGWETLVEAKVDSRPDCIPCHVVGYKQPGGFQTGDDAAKLGDVQCENCHGMGTQHEAWPTQAKRITEETCRSCHTASTSPVFDFAVFEPHIRHKRPATLPPLPVNPAKEKMKSGH